VKINKIEVCNFQRTNKPSYNNVVLCDNPIPQKEQPQQVYASHLGFRGKILTPKLLNEYNWFINKDGIPAINSLLKLNAPASELEELVNYILKDNQLSYNLIDSIVTQPRQNKTLAKILQEKIPNENPLRNIHSPIGSFHIAYENYLDSRYKNAKSVSELLKIRPDWKEDALLAKHRELHGNNDFELGTVPDSIGAENFEPIINYLHNFVDYGFKTEKQIGDLNLNGKIFKFRNFIDGKSSKNVFKIDVPNGEAFVLKMGNANDRGLNKPFEIGTCAIIDTYLTQNNCRNSAPLRYYNHNSNTAIYNFIEHNKPVDKIEKLNEFQEKMPDFYDLGLSHNDTVGSNNYFILEDNQNSMKNTYDFDYGVEHEEFISVDNDHVTYNLPLIPMSYKYSQPLPCEMQMFF
jgi:hypothetical protein